MLSYELFWNSRVGNISFTSSSTLCFGRIHLQGMICQQAACHILLRIQTFLIEIFGRGVPSPLFFRLSFLLPFNSIYTVANRKKLPENSAKTVKQSPFSLSLIHLVLILWHISSISDTGNAEKWYSALSASQEEPTPKERGGFSG